MGCLNFRLWCSIVVPVCVALIATPLVAQHDHPHPPHDSIPAPDSMGGVHDMGNMPMNDMPQHDHSPDDSTHHPVTMGPIATDSSMMTMMHPGPLGIPMDRAGSGTSWLPDVSPMYAAHHMLGTWTVMLHGAAFLQYDDQGSSRGDRQFGSINWGMLMATHDFGAPVMNPTSRLTLRAMLSLDPITVTKRGYPLLLQSGESYRGAPLHDRQHPHDFFMEIAALYDRQLTHTFGFELYAAPVGEPSIGPVAFMHRPSAANDPFGPISHHWQDATHISFGVFTAGLFTKTVKLESSIFNGREPDENRYDFDFRRFDSYSGRLTINPNTHWSLQSSYAFLKSPEALTPQESQHRITASAMYGRAFNTSGNWSTTFVYGANKHSGDNTLSNSALAETNLTLNKRNTIFARFEYVQKSAADLVIPTPTDDHFDVTALALGYVRELATGQSGSLGLGARGSVNAVPAALRPAYETRTPLGLSLFLRYRPNGTHTAEHGSHQHSHHH